MSVAYAYNSDKRGPAGRLINPEKHNRPFTMVLLVSCACAFIPIDTYVRVYNMVVDMRQARKQNF